MHTANPPLISLRAQGEVMGASFATANRNKRSIALDCKSEQGRAVLLRLVAQSDVFVQNMRPGVAERLGIGYASLRAANPSLIYVSISGFGSSGPLSGDPVYDPLVQARSGIVATQARIGDAGRTGHNPVSTLVNSIIVDKTTAMTVAQAVTAALYTRDVRGAGGQHIEVSMLDVAMQFNWPDLFVDHVFGAEDKRLPLMKKELLVQEGYAVFPCKGSRSVVFSANAGVLVEHKWQAICTGLQLPQLLSDPRFAKPGHRMRNLRDIFRAFDTATLQMEVEEVEALFRSVDVGVAPVLSVAESLEQPQVKHCGNVLEVGQGSKVGMFRQARAAALFSHTEAVIPGPPPLYAEHGREILVEAGFSEAEVAALERQNSVGLPRAPRKQTPPGKSKL